MEPMRYRHPEICFVGQGPNQASWHENFRKAERHKLDGQDAITFAIQMGRRLALTGAVGNRLGALLGIERLDFCVQFRRENLNDCFNGKAGRGDKFNMQEAITKAQALIADATIRRFVLLGNNVNKAFKPEQPYTPLMHFVEHRPREYAVLVIPHPSGLNKFYNDPEMSRHCAEMLRSFVGTI